MVFLAIGGLVNIPEESVGNVRLFNSYAFVNIYANTDGRIAKLFVKDKILVNEGDILAMIDNPLAFREYQVLNNTLRQLDSIIRISDSIALSTFEIPWLNHLGSMQSRYQELRKRLQQFSAHIQSKEYAQQCDAIQKEGQIHKAIAEGLEVHLNLLDQSVVNKTRNLERMQHLHATELISDVELEGVETDILAVEMKQETLKGGILENKLNIHECNKQLMELAWKHNMDRDDRFLGIQDIHKQLLEQLQLWEEKYLIRAPVSGNIQLADLWEELQQLNDGEILMTILPANDQSVSAKMQCPANEAVKVKQGNEVLIELQGYPAITHGYIRGKVKCISEVRIEGMYTVDIILSSGLNTTLGKTLQFNRYAEGWGKIITGEKTFLLDLFKKIIPDK
jgi:multidrug resistance efflux pump